MRLLHIIASMDPASGGPCQGIRNSNPEMEKLGVYREIVSLDAPTSAFLGMDEFPIHALGPTTGPWKYSAKLIPWLLENLGRFDVVIINGLWLYSSFAGWKTMRIIQNQNRSSKYNLSRIPKLFIMPHGMLDPYFQRAADRRLKAIRNWLYWKLIERKVVNDAYGILFTCETELQLARETFTPYHPKREINVGYGIIPPPAYTEAMQTAFAAKSTGVENQPYLLFLSRIHEKKGVDLLISAYAQLLERAEAAGNTIPKLVIAGPGLDTAFGKKLLQLAAASAQLRNAVIFTGMLTGDAKWGAIYGCEAFVLPSHQENFGIAVVEAMACSRPVLISNQVNIWMEIEAGNGGIIAHDTLAGTLKMLQQWLDTAAADQEVMGKHALEVYQKHFHIGPSSIFFLNAITS